MTTPDLLPGDKVDLTNCDREPIHIPGSIQPHGVMLILAEPDLTITQLSANTLEHFGVRPENLLGLSLARLTGAAELAVLRAGVLREDLNDTPRYLPSLLLGDKGLVFERIIHRSQGALILECELQDHSAETHLDLYPQLKASISRLERTVGVREFFQRAAEQVRAFTGYDRVMVYQFMDDDSGSVIAEDKRDDLESFFGLHYPASDIPKQARALYLKSWLRFVVDVNVEAVPLKSQVQSEIPATIDMSYSVIRSTSLIHREYLRNMGVQSSMSISLIKNGKLWGLVACHHYVSAKILSHSQRMACEFLAHLLSLQMVAKETADDHDYSERINKNHATLVDAMAKDESLWYRGLTDSNAAFRHYIDASGVAVCAKEIQLFGRTPNETHVRDIAAWFCENAPTDVFSSHQLPLLFPEANSALASGLLAARISKRLNECVLWFRPAEMRVVNWAGDPNKPVTIGEHGARLTPRHSFALWQETVENKAAPWKNVEVEAAKMLRRSIIEVITRRAEELAKLNEELERTNSDLGSFAYIASHDLKEPLRGIHNYSTFLLEDYADKLDKPGQDQLQTLVRLSKRLESLIDSLLHYSRTGRSAIEPAEVDFRRLINDALEMVETRIKESGTEVVLVGEFPNVVVDQDSATEILTNLITNGIKYNDKPKKRVEIGMIKEMTAPDGVLATRVCYVKDNGIGIAITDRDAIFRVFKRLHGRNEFGGGSGLGLAIVRKVVERHGGKIWVDSVLNESTTFYFTLAREGI